MNIYRLLRPLLFRMDPELAHDLVMATAPFAKIAPIRDVIQSAYHFEDPKLEFELLGLKFTSPIGLAAGIDKNCRAIELLSCLGPSAIEVGIVSAKPQSGNESPRIFRYPNEQALVNRMGGPNIGADAAALNLINTRRTCKHLPLIGLNIGKSTIAPMEKAAEDYTYTFTKFYEHVDYFIVNVSCPNIAGYSKLQERAQLNELLSGLQTANFQKKPLTVKLSPDLSEPQIDEALSCCLENGVSGIIATNTSLSRDGLPESAPPTGGMSGKPLFPRSVKMVSLLSKKLNNRLPIIGVGGIFSAEDVITMLKAGASAVELYTALVYEGPSLLKTIKQDLVKLMDRDGIKNITEYRP